MRDGNVMTEGGSFRCRMSAWLNQKNRIVFSNVDEHQQNIAPKARSGLIHQLMQTVRRKTLLWSGKHSRTALLSTNQGKCIRHPSTRPDCPLRPPNNSPGSSNCDQPMVVRLLSRSMWPTSHPTMSIWQRPFVPQPATMYPRFSILFGLWPLTSANRRLLPRPKRT